MIFLYIVVFVIKYDLKKSTDLGKSWTILMKDVISFGHQDKFLYVAVPEKAGVLNEVSCYVLRLKVVHKIIF